MASDTQLGAPDRPTVIAASAYLTGVNALVINVQPIIMGALADGRGLSSGNLGQLSAIFIAFNTLCFLGAPLWIRRVSWRSVAFLSAMGASFVILSGAVAVSFTVLLLVFALLGLVKGFMGAIAFASLGDARNPDRAYGVSVVVQSVLAALVATPLSAVVLPRWGVAGLFIVLALVFTTACIACRWLPATRAESASSEAEPDLEAPKASAAAPAIIALAALGLFTGGIIGFWFFLERIGAARGVSGSLVGVAVSLCALSTILSAVLVAALGGRVSSMMFVWAGSAMVLAGFAALAAPGDIAFMSSALLFALGWGLAQPAYWAVVRKVDGTGRLFVAAPAVSGFAGALVGLTAGVVIAWGGYGGLIQVSGGLVMVAAILLVIARGFARRSRVAVEV